MSVSPQHYASFLERMGHTVRQVHDLWWFNSSRGVYTCFPFDRESDAAGLPIREILKRDGLAVRFACPLSQGIPSFRIVCRDRNYDLPALRSRTRTQVRRGLEACAVERVDFAVLRKSAIPLNADTLIRQGRRVPQNLESYWQKYFAEAARTEGAEAWAAFTDGQLAAYLIAFTVADVTNLLIVRSSLDHLAKFPNNALLFRFLHDRLRDPQISQVVYGYESIKPGLESLDQFKTGMGFEQVAVGQRIELTGWVQPLINRFTTPTALRILQRYGRGETLAKLQGLLTWYSRQPLRADMAACTSELPVTSPRAAA